MMYLYLNKILFTLKITIYYLIIKSRIGKYWYCSKGHLWFKIYGYDSCLDIDIAIDKTLFFYPKMVKYKTLDKTLFLSKNQGSHMISKIQFHDFPWSKM